MSIGLKRGTVALEEHSAEWEASARELIRKLKEVLGEDAVDVQHVGSTAIKRVCAKPIVDIAVGVRDFERMFRHNAELERVGVLYRREDHPGQHLYVCGDMENQIQTHFVHVVIWGGEAWNNYLNMRDYLNARDDMADRYDALKRQLAAIHSDDRTAYTAGKSALIEDILCRAKQWREEQK